MSKMFPCIEFSHNKVKFCAAGKKKGKTVIEHLAVFDNPSQLKSYLDEKKIALKEYSLLIPTHLAAIRFLRLPSRDPREITDMVRWQAAKQLPYSPEEIIYSYYIVNTEEAGFSNIILFITRKDTVEQYLKALDVIGRHPSALSLSCEGLKLLYAFQAADDPNRKQENTALVELGLDSASVSLTQKGILTFVRGVSVPEGAGSAEKSVSEIMLSLETYRRLGFSQVINRIVINGPEEIASQVIDLLKPDISMALEKIDYRRGLDFAEGEATLTVRKEYTFSQVIGAALGAPDIKMNLLPREVIGEASFYRSRNQFINTSILALGVVMLGAGICAKKIYDKNSLLAYLNAELSTLGEDTVKLDEKARRLELVNKQMQKGSSVLDAISEVYNVVPSGITFSNVLYEQDKGLTIRGNAKDMSLVFKFVSALEAAKSFSGVQVGYVTKRKTSSGETIDFEISAPLQK